MLVLSPSFLSCQATFRIRLQCVPRLRRNLPLVTGWCGCVELFGLCWVGSVGEVGPGHAA